MVAKNNKKVATEIIVKQTFMMKLSSNKKSLTRWDLLLTGIEMGLKTTPPTWIISFKRVNFKEWKEKIFGF